MNNQEVRSLSVEVRADEQDGSRKVFGYPIVFGKPSNDIGFIEYIDKGALKDVDLSGVYLVYAHDPNQPLARVDAGTLKLKVDDTGLYFEATLPNTT
ncbi:HK97 family phage prohead protease, partial [Weissella confusa]